MLTRYNPDENWQKPLDDETVWAQETLNRLEFCTLKEAAKAVGKHPKTIQRLIDMNVPSIAFRKTDNGTIIYLPSVFKHYGKVFNRE